MNVLVIGGTMFIGRLLVHELLRAGHEVTVLHRKPKHDFGRRVGNLKADRNDAASLKAALDGRRFDVVFDNVYDWERGTTGAQVEATARLLAGDWLHRYVYLSSVAAYGDGLNHHEGDALAPDDHADSYVRNKAMAERALFRMHQRDRFPAVTLRPPFLYGPGNNFYREAFFWDRLRDRRPIIVPGDGRRLMQFVHVRDLVGAMLRAVEIPEATGQAFNIANPRPISQIDMLESIARAAGRLLHLVRIPREQIRRAGGTALGPRLYFAFYFDLPPITMVVNKAQRVLKCKPIDFDEGMKETYHWWQRHNLFPRPDYAFEDSLVALAATLPPHPAEG
jgi:nucleoside-diphosphate-sugar epimerase